LDTKPQLWHIMQIQCY